MYNKALTILHSGPILHTLAFTPGNNGSKILQKAQKKRTSRTHNTSSGAVITFER